MGNHKTIKLALEYAKKYDNDIYSLIKDLNIRLYKINLDDLYGFTVNINNQDLIYVNCNDINYLDFIIAHEVGHIILHDCKIRAFNKIVNNKDKEELQANLFATLFLGYGYKDCSNDNYVQKIINYINYNYIVCNMMKIY